MAEPISRDVALTIAVHLVRWELRRPDLLALADNLMDRYRFTEKDRQLLAASIRSHNWLAQYLAEAGVPDNLEARDAFVADLLGRVAARLLDIQAAIADAKHQTERLRAARDGATPPDAKG